MRILRPIPSLLGALILCSTVLLAAQQPLSPTADDSGVIQGTVVDPLGMPVAEAMLTCKGIIAIPPRYFEDQIGADRSVQRSLKEPRTLLVEKIGSNLALAWNPTEVEFLDSASGQTQKFQVGGIEFLQPGSLKLPIVA